MEQLTLEQAAYRMFPNDITWQEAFKEGAEWQKEQYKELSILIAQANGILYHTGYGDLADKIEAQLELLWPE